MGLWKRSYAHQITTTLVIALMLLLLVTFEYWLLLWPANLILSAANSLEDSGATARHRSHSCQVCCPRWQLPPPKGEAIWSSACRICRCCLGFPRVAGIGSPWSSRSWSSKCFPWRPWLVEQLFSLAVVCSSISWTDEQGFHLKWPAVTPKNTWLDVYGQVPGVSIGSLSF